MSEVPRRRRFLMSEVPLQSGAGARRGAPPAGRHQALLAPRRARGSHEGAFSDNV